MTSRKKTPLDPDLIVIEIPLVLSKFDVQHGDWAQDKHLWLRMVYDTYENAMDNEIEKKGWLKKTK
jgi:hypothetical protein